MNRLTWTGLSGARSGATTGRCLGEELTAYADRLMDGASLLRWDRHVVACLCCRAAVEDERRVLASLRGPAKADVPGDLRGMLLAMAASTVRLDAPEDDPAAASGPRRQDLRWPPSVAVAPIPVVDRGTPALHRSARRATVFAGLAAGATAAAAWSVVVTGTAATSPTTPVSPVVQSPRTANAGFATAAFTVRGLGSPGVFRAGTPTTPPSVSAPGGRSAESTP
ncbi:hypothetical protein [Pedococcus sp. 5OH_020]|uniref:hypothetical protein n=1 Tax=Pedococcus sp. 5OH_020 TaxID=2989814 RepID=UPI0022EA0AE8|nr:hypothetical protein [Pedococcus sp. 5OH_020]